MISENPPRARNPKRSASARALAREDAQARREVRLQRRRAVFDLTVSGFPHEQIAAKMGLSVATIRREVDVALAARAPDSADRYVALQLARLQKAMVIVALALEDGNLQAVPALATLFGQFDRYHGLAALLSAQVRGAVALQDSAPKSLETSGR